MIILKERRDKKLKVTQIQNFLNEKESQKKVWEICTGIYINLGRRSFSSIEAKHLFLFLFKTFEIRKANLEYLKIFQKNSLGPRYNLSKRTNNHGEFDYLFPCLQNIVYAKKLTFQDALHITKAIIDNYPLTRNLLKN